MHTEPHSAIPIILFGVFFWLAGSLPLSAQQTITIPAGTAIRIRTKQPISSETAQVGDDVSMEVLADVAVDGYVVIHQGAQAVAVVSVAKEAKSIGRRGHVAISLKYVESVTGQHVFASGQRSEKGDGKKAKIIAEVGATALLTPVGSLLWLVENGNDSVIPPGTAFTVFAAADTQLDLRQLPPGAMLLRTRPSGPENLPLLGIVLDSNPSNFLARVTGVAQDSAGERAGLRVGYLIMAVNDVATHNVREVSDAVAALPPNATTITLDCAFSTNLGYMPKKISVNLKY